jgi:signal transduction histidine kinase
VTARSETLTVPEARPAQRANAALLLVLGGVFTVGAVLGLVAPLAWVSYSTPNVPTLLATWLSINSFLFLGLYAFAKRPENRVGLLMMAVGFAYSIQSIGWIATDVTYTVGTFFLRDLWLAVLAHLFLAFPTGRLKSRLDRRLVIAGYAWWFVSTSLPLAFLDFRANGWAFDNVLLVDSNNDLADAIGRTNTVITAGLALVFLYALIRHWRDASPAGRRVLVPVVWASLPTAAFAVSRIFGDTLQMEPLNDILNGPVGIIATTTLPIGFAVGLLRSRLGRSRVGDLVVELGEAPAPGRARDTLARILRDPTLQIVYRPTGSTTYVDETGRPVSVNDDVRAVTPIERAGERVAALVHDPAVLQDPELLRTAVAATRLAVENERLQAEVRAQLEEVRSSRARIVEAGDAERRRVERNLHDGAQQRLVTMSLSLRQLQGSLPEDASPSLASSVDELLAESKQAIDELRELARGIHPAILTEEGIAGAVASLADRSPVPVRIECAPEGRFPDAFEATVYFVVAECLANVAKYASASRAAVAITASDGILAVEVTDDGIGGADVTKGTGIRGILDRVEAVGGGLTVESPTGGGTVVRAEVPLDGR